MTFKRSTSRTYPTLFTTVQKAVPLHTKQVLGGRRSIAPSSYSFSTVALDGGEWSASRAGCAVAPGKGLPVQIVQEAGWAPEPVKLQLQLQLQLQAIRHLTSDTKHNFFTTLTNILTGQFFFPVWREWNLSIHLPTCLYISLLIYLFIYIISDVGWYICWLVGGHLLLYFGPYETIYDVLLEPFAMIMLFINFGPYWI
jgi:hypothetical protein